MKTSSDLTKKLIIASPHGFCSGVSMAISSAEAAINAYPKPVYCLNEIVHNRLVVENLRAMGMIFVKTIDDIPRRANALFSAHGVSPVVREQAAQRDIHVIDATCPFVTKIHKEVRRRANEGYTILLIGHLGHEEIEGIAGEAPENVIVVENKQSAMEIEVKKPDKIVVMTQTTLSVNDTDEVINALKSRFPRLQLPAQSDICYATQNRQQAVRDLAAKVDIVVVLGALNSSNSNRLVEVARGAGCDAMLASSIDELNNVPDSLMHVGLTAGASTPEYFVNEAVNFLCHRDSREVETLDGGCPGVSKDSVDSRRHVT